MQSNSANNSPGGRFSTVPKLCFAYGPEEYVAATVSKFSVDDDVIWTCPGASGMLSGKIEFIGRKLEQKKKENDGPSKENFAAVVVFDQPTCHLPNHLANPPSNRNLVPVDQLISKGEGQWQLSTVHSVIQDASKRFQLVGNCIATREEIEKISLDGYPIGDVIFVETKEAVIGGKVMVTGRMKDVFGELNDGSLINYVGVKFGKSLKACFPDITLQHFENDDRCSRCAGGTLAFIPVKFLSYGKRIPVGTNTISRIRCIDGNNVNKSEEIVRGNEKEKSKEKRTPLITVAPQQQKPKKPPVLFIGNCVALEKGVENKKVKGIKKGYNVIARTFNNEKELQGVACLVCSINGLDNLQQDCLSYVKIRFERSFADLCDRDQVVMHCNLLGKPTSACKKCEGGKVVFIPADCLLKKDSFDGGIYFEVATK